MRRPEPGSCKLQRKRRKTHLGFRQSVKSVAGQARIQRVMVIGKKTDVALIFERQIPTLTALPEANT